MEGVNFPPPRRVPVLADGDALVVGDSLAMATAACTAFPQRGACAVVVPGRLSDATRKIYAARKAKIVENATLLRVVRGRVLDVAVDIRKGSATYGQHVAVELTEENHKQMFIPRGFAHGFAVLSEEAIFQYKCDAFYAPEAEGGISILDASLGIDWGLSMTEAILSEKDTQHPLLKDFESPFTL